MDGSAELVGLALTPIGAGTTRDCYAYPQRGDLCIKLPKTARGFKQTSREPRYLARLERRFPAELLARLPSYHGCVMTTHGIGWVVDRVIDADGAPAPRMLEAFPLDPSADDERWQAALAGFQSWLLATPAVLRDLSPTNICVQTLADGALNFVPIDGLCPGAALHRWWPTRTYAGRGRKDEIMRGGFDSLDNLRSRVRSIIDHYEHISSEPQAARARLLDRPSLFIRLGLDRVAVPPGLPSRTRS